MVEHMHHRGVIVRMNIMQNAANKVSYLAPLAIWSILISLKVVFLISMFVIGDADLYLIFCYQQIILLFPVNAD